MPYDVAVVCENGHEINSFAGSMPQFTSKHCPKCGGKGISACPQCASPIRGSYDSEVSLIPAEYEIPNYCTNCGAAYPWTVKQAEALSEVLDELAELPSEERQKLKASIPDLLAETPKSDLAANRYKKAISKLSGWGGKLLADTVSKVAVESVKVLMFGS